MQKTTSSPDFSFAPSPHPAAPPPAPALPNAPSGARLMRLGDLLGDWEREAGEAFEARRSGQARGPVSGFAALDHELGGCFAPGLHIVHGQPGAGKSAFALQIAALCGTPALFVSCEMAPLELLRRHTARATGTFLGRLKSGEMSPDASLSLARRACALAPRLALCDATRDYAPPPFLRDAALASRGDSPHLLIIVDSLHSWAQSAEAPAPEYEVLNLALVALRQLGHELGCPVLAVAERNRGSMQGGGLSAGAGTRKIEYGAETVLDLERDPTAREDASGEVEVAVKFVKNRHGAGGKKVDLHFHGALQKFREG